jgi:uncharacterized protein YqhQ
MSGTPKIGYGGQAVLEGVMIRGRRYMAVACRAPDNKIVLQNQKLPVHLYSGVISRIPLLRGMIMLWDSLVLGMSALAFAADVAMRDEDTPDQGKEATPAIRAVTWGSVAVALVLGIGLFFVLPLALVGLFERSFGASIWSHVIEGVVRLALLIGYVALIGLAPDIRRVYQYHGAEHMTIHAFEHDDPLTVAEVEKYPTAHPRCGTAFLLLVVALSILVFAVVGTPELVTRIVSRIVLVPVIAGIAYEILKFGGANYDKSPLV